MHIMRSPCNWRRHRTHPSGLPHLTVLPLMLMMLVTASLSNASSKSGQQIQLFPLAQHVDSSVAKKLQNILPALSARLWTHLQIVKRELKQDLRNIRVLLEEHAGVTHPQAVGDSIPSVVQTTTKAPSREEEADTSPVVAAKNLTEEHEKRDEDQQCTVMFDRNMTQAVGELKKILEEGLVTVTEACVKEIEENNQAIFDQQRMIIKTLELITKRMPGYNVGSLPLPSRTLPFPASNQVVAPRDCWDVLKRNIPAVNNVNVILPLEDSAAKPRRVRCEHRTAGGGWTVVLHRQQQQLQLSFRRDWREYREGFGDPTGEYWIGLQTLHELTRDAPYELRVNLAIGEEEAHSVYTHFSVGPSSVPGTGYRLNVSGYRDSESTAGDALSYHSGMAFTTYDTDNDVAKGGSCSLWCGGGGWWYNYCFNANPTGVYPPEGLSRTTEGDVYIEWRTWQGYYAYLTRLTMMIRPQKDLAT